MGSEDAYDIWSHVIDTHMSSDTAATWKFFWDDQEPLSDDEFELLKDMCYSSANSDEEHELLFKLVNRELTLRLKNHRNQEAAFAL